MSSDIDSRLSIEEDDHLARLPWSFAHAHVSAKGDPADPTMSPATGTATHTGYQNDDLNADDH